MKVISLTEPFATLIKEKKKRIEKRNESPGQSAPGFLHNTS